MPERTVLVAVERMPGWVERFGDRHGEVTTSRAGERVTLTAADGAVATYVDNDVPDEFGLVLVRRGGYAVGRVRGTGLIGSRCGTRYVQGRTKAGGWSQKRYARRRAGQVDKIVGAAAEAVERVFADDSGLTVLCGGDRELVRQTLAAARVRLRTGDRWLDVREPRYAVLEKAVTQARAVEVRLNELA